MTANITTTKSKPAKLQPGYSPRPAACRVKRFDPLADLPRTPTPSVQVDLQKVESRRRWS